MATGYANGRSSTSKAMQADRPRGLYTAPQAHHPERKTAMEITPVDYREQYAFPVSYTHLTLPTILLV